MSKLKEELLGAAHRVTRTEYLLPARWGADLSQPISPLLHDCGEDNSIDVSSLSVLTPADPCEPPTHPPPRLHPPPGVGVRYRALLLLSL